MNRREVFAALAGLPLVGFLFGKESESSSMYVNGDESRPVKPGESVYLHDWDCGVSGGIQTPSIHIPNEDGSITCIPISKNFFLYHWNVEIKNGPTAVKFLLRDNRKVSESFYIPNNHMRLSKTV